MMTREAFFAHCRRVWRRDWPELLATVQTTAMAPTLPPGLRNPPPMPPVPPPAREVRNDIRPAPPPAPPRPRDRRYTVDVNIQEKPVPEITDKALEKLVERSKRLDRVEDSLSQLKKRIDRHIESAGVAKYADLSEEHKAALFVVAINDLLVTVDHLLGVQPTTSAPHLDKEADD